MEESRKTNAPNSLLRHERENRGWSQSKLARLLNIDTSMISRWESGNRKPEASYQEKLCTLFGKSAVELGFIAPKETSLIIATTLSTTDQMMSDRLDNIESIINLAWEAWFASRPKQAKREITKLLPHLEKMIYMPLAAIHILHAKELVIRCHGLLGAIYLDALQNDTALYHYIQAHQFSEEIHDTNLAVTYLALMGDVLRRQNEKTTAISYIENARYQAANAERATVGHILQLLAYTYGDIGNETAFEQTISEATHLLAFTGEGRDISEKEFIPFEIYEIRGKIYRDLGRPLDALPYLELAEKSLSTADVVTPRWHALLEISRAQVYCDAGDIDTGIDLACKGFIKAYQCRSSHQMNRVRKLLRKLENSSYRNHPRIRDLKNLLYETYMRMDNEDTSKISLRHF